MFEQAFENIDDVLWKEAGCRVMYLQPACGTFGATGSALDTAVA